ncbi:hypothetical protein GFS31_24000 [Leptolyngbya sp. BL0902]|uniref:serine/threonine-protein kinase n=1 Tax=Leptolyngbya sp. BL0902 TaxID=1115757 RepID=UPI0018E897CC|nr:serine/threonine-protein kinase [Leptolyngbya sp. BL0902]QQE65712.1 hypothetical protein GFS31_24000 [Leptolyngbya sp. BL0902]
MGRTTNRISPTSSAAEPPPAQPGHPYGGPSDDNEVNALRDQPLGGRYQLLRQLSAGGFSHTFLAADLHLPNHPRCVLKQFRMPEGQTAETQLQARQLFDNEARVLYELGSHPQIPTLLAHFEEDQQVYLAQEYIEGSRLSRQIEAGKPWSETRVLLLLQEVLEILSFIHRQQVIHRDIKPSNLIRRHRDGKIVLIDFGAVQQVRTISEDATAPGTVSPPLSIGTQGYMPPEQRSGQPCFSSDVYAVGIMGIRALTGLHPQTLGTSAGTHEIHWRPYAPGVSSGLAEVLDQMVRSDFRDRYANAQAALDALQHLPNGFSASIAHLYQTWYRGVGGLVPSPISAPGDTQLVPAETSEATAIAIAQEDTALLPVENTPVPSANGPNPGPLPGQGPNLKEG